MPVFPADLLKHELQEQGYMCLHGVFSPNEMAACIATIDRALTADLNASGVASRDGGVYASRNVLQLCPEVRDIWRVPTLLEFLRAILGDEFGLIRILYFDKPPERTWALPWHKDLTITVAEGNHTDAWGRRPTLRAGIPHVEAPLSVLENMLTLRIHLDAATSENGPLQVLPGSHRTGKELVLQGFTETSITSNAGDVLAMRPLLAHCSGKSRPETTQHRRVLHLEFAASRNLPDGFTWHTFIPANASEPRSLAPLAPGPVPGV